MSRGLDTFSRVCNLISGFAKESTAVEDCPILALYDIANAFPTIAHVWLHGPTINNNFEGKTDLQDLDLALEVIAFT